MAYDIKYDLERITQRAIRLNLPTDTLSLTGDSQEVRLPQKNYDRFQKCQKCVLL